MSAEAVAARARAARSCCFATNQRPQVPRLRALPSGTLAPTTPHSTTSSEHQPSDSGVQREHSTGASHSEHCAFDPAGRERDFELRKGQLSSSSGTSAGSSRDDVSQHRSSRTSSSGAPSLLQSPGTPDPGRFRPSTWELPQRKLNAPACLDTISSVCEDDSGPLTTSTVDSEWTLSGDDSDSDADSLSVPLSSTADSAPRSVLQYVARFEGHSASLSEASSAGDPAPLSVPHSGTHGVAAGPQARARAGAHPMSHCVLQLDMCPDTDSACSTCTDAAHVEDLEAGDSAPNTSVSQLDTVRVRVHSAEAYCVLGSNTEPGEDGTDRRSSVNGGHLSDSCASSRRSVSDASGLSAQASLSLSAEALVYESNEGNNPLFWEPQAEAPCEGDAGEDSMELAAERELYRMFASGSEHTAARSTDYSRVHGHGQEGFDGVHASAACMVEQPMPCWEGSQLFNPLPLLTVDRTPSQSPDPDEMQGPLQGLAHHHEVVCSPTASVASSGSSVDSVLEDALRSAQPNTQQGVDCSMECRGAAGEEGCGAQAEELGPEVTFGGVVCEGGLSCVWREQELRHNNESASAQAMIDKSDSGHGDACVRERGDSVGMASELCRGQQLISQPVTLHALSRPASPDNARSRNASALNTSASGRSDKETVQRASEYDVVRPCEKAGPHTPRGENKCSEEDGTSTETDSTGGTPNFMSYPSLVA